MRINSLKKLLCIVFSFFLFGSGISQSLQQKTELKSSSFRSSLDNKSKTKVLPEKSNTETGNQIRITNSDFHFENEKLTPAVSNKVNFNKTHQRPLSEGILKSFKVSIKACNTVENTKKTFSFLYNTNGFVRADFLSDGLVNLIVIPEYNSVDLKDKILSERLNFNFISESYFLK